MFLILVTLEQKQTSTDVIFSFFSIMPLMYRYRIGQTAEKWRKFKDVIQNYRQYPINWSYLGYNIYTICFIEVLRFA